MAWVWIWVWVPKNHTHTHTHHVPTPTTHMGYPYPCRALAFSTQYHSGSSTGWCLQLEVTCASTSTSHHHDADHVWCLAQFIHFLAREFSQYFPCPWLSRPPKCSLIPSALATSPQRSPQHHLCIHLSISLLPNFCLILGSPQPPCTRGRGIHQGWHLPCTYPLMIMPTRSWAGEWRSQRSSPSCLQTPFQVGCTTTPADS